MASSQGLLAACLLALLAHTGLTSRELQQAAPAPPPPTCEISSHNYHCSRTFGSGVVMHWTSGSALPPNNTCTGSIPQDEALGVASPATRVHYLFEVETKEGYISLAFKMEGGGMSPIDAVIARLGSDGTVLEVGSYYLAKEDAVPSERTAVQWITHQGAARVGTKTLLCFSRSALVGVNTSIFEHSDHGAHARHLLAGGDPLEGTVVSKELDLTKNVKYNWAIGPLEGGSGWLDRKVMHSRLGSFVLNMAHNDAGGATSEREKKATTHGILTAVAFALLMPAATLAARHRLLWSGRMLGGQASWFWVHLGGHLAACVLLIAGISIALVEFELPNTGVEGAHRVMGLVVLALTGAQIIAGFIRPGPGHKLRPLFNLVHATSGGITILLSWATLYTGVHIYHEIYAVVIPGEIEDRYHAWIGCLVAAMGLTVLLDLFLTVLRWKSQHSARGPASDAVAPAPGKAAAPPAGSQTVQMQVKHAGDSH